MAGIHFEYSNFKQLLQLNIGISDRLDENRAESFTILYCDLGDVEDEVIKSSLQQILRTSDSIVNHHKDYFFVLPYTDKYGANIVKGMFDEFFARYLNSFLISYPADGDDADELIEILQNSVKTFCKKDLSYLDFLK